MEDRKPIDPEPHRIGADQLAKAGVDQPLALAVASFAVLGYQVHRRWDELRAIFASEPTR